MIHMSQCLCFLLFLSKKYQPMKRHFTLAFTLFLVVILQAQITPMVGDKYEVVGRNLLTNRDIIAYKETFDEVVYHVAFDSLSNTALLTLWNPDQKGRLRRERYERNMVLYDLERQTANWNKIVNLKKESLYKHGPYVLYRYGKDYTRLDLSTGEPVFNLGRRVRPFVIDAENGWLVCATDRSKWAFRRGIHDFRKVDLNTNEICWTRLDLNSTEEMEYMGRLNDTMLIFEGSGLHAINENDGTGWDVVRNTKKTYYAGGYTYYPVEVASKPTADTNAVYMADANSLVRVDYEGNVVWSTDLPAQKMSHSLIGFDKGLLVLVNEGYARCYPVPYFAQPVLYGRSFIAGFNLSDGKQRYMRELEKRFDVVSDVDWIGDALYLIINGRRDRQVMEKYDTRTGELVAKRDLTAAIYEVAGDAVGLVGSFIGSKAYMKQDSTWVSLHDLDTTAVFVACENGVLRFDGNLVNKGYLRYEDIYILACELDGLRYFAKGQEIVAVDSNGREVATLGFHDLYCTESEIYSIKDKTLYIINRDQLKIE